MLRLSCIFPFSSNWNLEKLRKRNKNDSKWFYYVFWMAREQKLWDVAQNFHQIPLHRRHSKTLRESRCQSGETPRETHDNKECYNNNNYFYENDCKPNHQINYPISHWPHSRVGAEISSRSFSFCLAPENPANYFGVFSAGEWRRMEKKINISVWMLS